MTEFLRLTFPVFHKSVPNVFHLLLRDLIKKCVGNNIGRILTGNEPPSKLLSINISKQVNGDVMYILSCNGEGLRHARFDCIVHMYSGCWAFQCECWILRFLLFANAQGSKEAFLNLRL